MTPQGVGHQQPLLNGHVSFHFYATAFIDSLVERLASRFIEPNGVEDRHVQNTAKAAVALFRDAGSARVVTRLVFHHVVTRVADQVALIGEARSGGPARSR